MSQAYITLPGAAGFYASTPDSAVLSITGDIDIQARVSPTSWTVGSAQAVVDKEFNTVNRSYRLDLNIAKLLTFIHGTAADHATAVTNWSTTTVPFSDGQAGWVRVTCDVDNGAGGCDVRFYTAADSSGVPGSWTQLGTTITGAGTTDLYDNSGPLEIGSRGVGTASPFAGKIYRARVLNGIAGTVVFDADFTDRAFGASFAESSANAATVSVWPGCYEPTWLPAAALYGNANHYGYEAKKLDAPEPAPKTTFPAATGGTTYPVAR